MNQIFYHIKEYHKKTSYYILGRGGKLGKVSEINVFEYQNCHGLVKSENSCKTANVLGGNFLHSAPYFTSSQ